MSSLQKLRDLISNRANDANLADLYVAVEGVSSWRSKEVLELFEALSKLREATLDDV